MTWIKENAFSLFMVFLFFGIMFLSVAKVYDMGVRQGQMEALKTAYEVCKKVAPLKDGVGCS